ncbi:hypothetical protein [Streptomyces sp. NPDC058326]|uniref:hypothetical protein n=1 Tax=Streptomyces sp. NPDC058326 TaxID=3346447 RepID=UPI0036E862A4
MDTKTTTEKPDESAEAAGKADGTESASAAETAPARDTAADPLDGKAGGQVGGKTEGKTDGPVVADGGAEGDGVDDEDEDEDDDEALFAEAAPDPAAAGIGGAAAAVVSAALGAVALTGTWTGKVVAERETLIGQIKTSGAGTPAQQISEIYGDAWHSTALVNGVFALVALLVAVLVLILPGRPAWVRAVAVAGAVLGGLGLLLSAGTYFDLFLSLPTAGS